MRAVGFSLIELMVVIAIVGVLAIIGLPAYSSYSTRAKIMDSYAKATSILNQVSITVEQTGQAPSFLTINGVNVPMTNGDWTYVDWGDIGA